jgi:hypothetical protein
MKDTNHPVSSGVYRSSRAAREAARQLWDAHPEFFGLRLFERYGSSVDAWKRYALLMTQERLAERRERGPEEVR